MTSAIKKARWGGNPGGLRNSSAEHKSNTTADILSAFEVKNKMKTIVNIKFPTTAAGFIAFQEAGIHRELGENERKLAALVVELFNLSYINGLQGRPRAGTTVDECIALGVLSPPETIECRQFIESVVYWRNLAYCQGRAAAEKEAEA